MSHSDPFLEDFYWGNLSKLSSPVDWSLRGDLQRMHIENMYSFLYLFTTIFIKCFIHLVEFYSLLIVREWWIWHGCNPYYVGKAIQAKYERGNSLKKSSLINILLHPANSSYDQKHCVPFCLYSVDIIHRKHETVIFFAEKNRKGGYILINSVLWRHDELTNMA